MRRYPDLRTLVIAFLVLLAPLTSFAAGQVGETAAPFSLNDTNGINHMLSDHLGEVVYLFMMGHG